MIRLLPWQVYPKNLAACGGIFDKGEGLGVGVKKRKFLYHEHAPSDPQRLRLFRQVSFSFGGDRKVGRQKKIYKVFRA